VLKRVFLQRATHLGTQTEYLHIATWTCRARSEREWAASTDANFTRS